MRPHWHALEGSAQGIVTFFQYSIGVEGFSMQHSVAVLADAEGNLLSSVRRRATMLLQTTEPTAICDRLSVLLLELLGLAGLPLAALERTSICLGMSGVTFWYDREVVLPQVLRRLQMNFGRVACTGDAEITFASHAQSDAGSLVISHAGSTAYVVGRAGGKLVHYRVGGWGPALGDEGSGFWIGRAALRAVGEEHDSHSAPSVLWQEIVGWLEAPYPPLPAWREAAQRWRIELRNAKNKSSRPDLDLRTLVFNFAHQFTIHDRDDVWRKTVAGLVIPVVKAYERGDRAAVEIIRAAVEHLANQHSKACQVAREESGIDTFGPVVLYGGVLTHNPRIRTALIARIRELAERDLVELNTRSENTMRPVLGALLFALGGSSCNDLTLAQQPVIDRVRKQQACADFQANLKND